MRAFGVGTGKCVCEIRRSRESAGRWVLLVVSCVPLGKRVPLRLGMGIEKVIPSQDGCGSPGISGMCQLVPASKQGPCCRCRTCRRRSHLPASGRRGAQPHRPDSESRLCCSPDCCYRASHPRPRLQSGGDLYGPWQRGRAERVHAHSRSAAGQNAPWKSCLFLPKTAQLGGAPWPLQVPYEGCRSSLGCALEHRPCRGLRAKAQEITADGGGGGVLPPPRSPLPPLCQAQPRTCWLRPTPSAYLGPLCSFASTGLSSFLPALPPPGHPSSLLPQESAQGPPGSALPRLHLRPAQSPALNGEGGSLLGSASRLCLQHLRLSLGTSPLAPVWPTLLWPLLSVGLTLTSPTQGVCCCFPARVTSPPRPHTPPAPSCCVTPAVSSQLILLTAAHYPSHPLGSELTRAEGLRCFVPCRK